jgi:hypothetical protein
MAIAHAMAGTTGHLGRTQLAAAPGRKQQEQRENYEQALSAPPYPRGHGTPGQ